MRITKVNIPKETNKNNGLEDIKMDKLGDIVLIAGKNGAGKTRILNKIFETLNKKPSFTHTESLKKRILDLEKDLNLLNASSVPIERIVINGSLKQLSTFEDLQKERIIIETNINDLRKEIGWNNIETPELYDYYTFTKFVPKQLNLADYRDFSKNRLLEHAKLLDNIDIKNIGNGVLSKIQIIQDNWFNATHPVSQISETEKQQAISDYRRLKEYIEVFLNTSLDRDINGDATLFNFPIGLAKLSDGQKILLQFCLAVYSQETALKDLILVMDEPENHLHPSIIIEVIDKIRQFVTNGQIWIATHSIPLLAHFDPSCIWYVEDGSIKHAGKIPEKVLSSLLGGEDNIAKLQDFISLPAQYATIRYAFECLFEPAAVMTGSQDSQTRQIRENLWRLAKDGKIKILDYGAGKGRLLSNIVEADEQNEEKLLEKIDYIAFDMFPDDKNYCENVLAKAYETSEKRYFNDIKTLLTHHDKGSFQVIIMCNVLHEIEPKDWINLFKEGGTLSSLLAENGVLLLVEDQQIPTGEKAYQKGFLVLDTPQLKELFNISSNNEDFIIHDFRNDGRLKAHIIPKRFLENICQDSRKKAIKSLADMAKENILKTRELNKNYQNGKLHGFWTQQFANAQLVLSEWE